MSVSRIRRSLGWLLILGAAGLLFLLVMGMMAPTEFMGANKDWRDSGGDMLLAIWLVTIVWTGVCLVKAGVSKKVVSIAGLLVYVASNAVALGTPVPRLPASDLSLPLLAFLYVFYVVPILQAGAALLSERLVPNLPTEP
jgi:hypothetical protein